MAPTFLHRLLSSLVSLLPIHLRAKMWKHLFKLGTHRWEGQSFAQRCPGAKARALQFVGTHTPLPVPVVIDNIEYEGSVWLVTSRLPGVSLAEVYRDITPEIERKLSSQLSRILAPLRALPPPDPSRRGRVCGFDGGPVYCARIRFGAPPAGPWDTVEAFHTDLMHRAGEINVPGEQGSVRRNILVDDNWNITGIVDWESCAWMPEYWEVTKGTFLPQYRKNQWPRIMSAAFPMYALEQEAEMYIIEYRQCYA
ncbi:hypothetical protein L226DRAFT_544050 [Lentinus tigrinus ALCF2SS1-7]|uniref:uncharacterized protein n=1 Tax=Lentinus tigrinus ALCF2SS1-7 TaxID=1328758 RepID=UPI001165F34A|nr:hypothetical protein L226DRAFT_544050 [Lentinus tigrinus ALCF2SS1-7]